ncbi:MAG: Inner rane protein YbbJ [Hyphomicrobiales bacterium]|nr:Inner rane protein YbbJ [Hyphomicrobiales bacterium]
MSIATNAWTWLIVGLLLCAGEAVAPGLFLLWIGLAALANGVLLIALPLDLPWLLLSFGFFTALFVLAGSRFYGSRDETSSDAPFLNRRAAALVGREARLQEAIVDGFGLVRIDDTVWRVAGPDLPAGARVRVVGLARDGAVLDVEPHTAEASKNLP